MEYRAAYRVLDPDDRGSCERDEFLLVNSVGYYEFDEEFQAKHRRDGRRDYYLAYNHSGSMRVLSRGEFRILGPGGIFIYKPFDEQLYGQNGTEHFQNYWVHFTGYGAFELLSTLGLGEGGVFSLGQSADIEVLFNEMIEEVTDKGDNYVQLSGALLMKIIALSSRKIAEQAVPSQSSGAWRIKQALQFIHRSYGQKTSVPELAAMSNLSTNRFAVIFKECLGQSPRQYMIDLRIHKACSLIRSTNLSIRQISSLVGFEDQLYFSRIFKNKLALTPSEFRARTEIAEEIHMDFPPPDMDKTTELCEGLHAGDAKDKIAIS
jgi:AraC family transcriptional regulator, arabinose operon regulatory protein